LTALYRLLAWLSPNFPTGAYSYSHGLEAAAESGAVLDRESLEAWVAAIIEHGCGRIDADILCQAYRAVVTGDIGALADAKQRGAAYRATAELALESAQQGAAFLATCDAAWFAAPRPASGERERIAHSRSASFPLPIRWGEGQGEGHYCCHSAIFGATAARAGIALEDALVGYLQAFAANLIAAGLRLGIIGQTDGQRILAALEPLVARAAQAALTRDPEDFGSATPAADLMLIAHETQYSRLFRS
jgi:urease accessory protein